MSASNIDQARKLLIGDGITPLKLEYFAIEGVAEQVRIALAVAEVPFDDVRIGFSDWAVKKPTTKYGQLPEMILPDGDVITESMAMLRLAGEADPEGKLYPSDMATRVKVEGVLGLVGDLSRAWRPALYIGMRPEAFGYPTSAEWDKEVKDATIKKVREAFLSNELPRYMGCFTDLLKESGGKFLLGDDLTIADIAAYQQILYFKKGIADYVPKECMDPFKEINDWMERVISIPKIAAYKAKAK
mmetsp:Transcript_4352/g.9689  ORF Transcript_4352/g.9689 Transcript_4352/m.9689 type:complete len:244 (-) Transcript_4352:123-854(-)